jgi:hypothetical protein
MTNVAVLNDVFLQQGLLPNKALQMPQKKKAPKGAF